MIQFQNAAMIYGGAQIGQNNKVPMGQSFILQILLAEAEGDDSLFIITASYNSSTGAITNPDKTMQEIGDAYGAGDKYFVLKLIHSGGEYYLPLFSLDTSTLQFVFADPEIFKKKVSVGLDFSEDALTFAVEEIAGNIDVDLTVTDEILTTGHQSGSLPTGTIARLLNIGDGEGVSFRVHITHDGVEIDRMLFTGVVVDKYNQIAQASMVYYVGGIGYVLGEVWIDNDDTFSAKVTPWGGVQ